MHLKQVDYYTHEAGHVIEEIVETDGLSRFDRYFVAVGHEYGEDRRADDPLDNALIIARDCAASGGCDACEPEDE